MRRALFLVILSFNYINSNGQNQNLWQILPQRTQEEQIKLGDYNAPKKFEAYQINYNLFEKVLSNTTAKFSNTQIISLPYENQETKDFYIRNSPVMEPALALKFPNIKTYEVKSVDDPTCTGRISTSSEGIFGLISQKGDYIIIRASKPFKNLDDYIVYNFGQDIEQLKNEGLLKCNFKEEDHGLENIFSSIESRDIIYKKMRQLRIAISCTSTFARDVGGTLENVMSRIVNTINQLNTKYHAEFGIDFILVDGTETLFNLDPDTDFFENTTLGSGLLNQNQEFLQSKLANSKYDLAQVYTTICSDVGGVVSGNICNNLNKAKGVICGPTNPSYFITTEWHETGHQFTAGHTFNACNGSTQLNTAESYEPGSGSTIMAYAGACGPDNISSSASTFFHISSIEKIVGKTNSVKNICGIDLEETNAIPEITISMPITPTIPIKTAYELEGIATDADNNELLYSWEQYDLGNGEPLGENFATGPLNRAYDPKENGNNRYIPRLGDILNDTYIESDRYPEVTRVLNWKLIARDQNPIAGASVSESYKLFAVETAGPFRITYPTAQGNTPVNLGEYVKITWDVANSDKAPVNCANVNIMLSVNNGGTFLDTLISKTPNDGEEWVMLTRKAVNARIKVKAADNIFLDISKSPITINESTTPGFSYDVFPHNKLLCKGIIQKFILKSINWGNYTKPFTVQVIDGLPQGATANFEANTIVPGSSTELNIDLNNSDESGQFHITIMATNDDLDTLYRYLDVQILGSTLNYVSTISPLEGQTSVVISPQFEWEKINGADSYEIQISTDPTFNTSTLFESKIVHQNKFTSLQLLLPNLIYYWRIRATNSCKSGDWSPINAFQTPLLKCNNISSIGLPKTISSNIASPPVRVDFNLSSQQGIVQDVNIRNVNILHEDVSRLRISAFSPSGKEIVLFGEFCFNFSNLICSFDDDAIIPINCSGLTQGSTFKPKEALSGFNGEPVEGVWSVQVKTVTGGAIGSVNDIDFELCSSIVPETISQLGIDTLYVKSGKPQIIYKNNLNYSAPSATDDNIKYIILSKPKHGDISSFGTIQNNGDHFLQSNILAYGQSYIPHDANFEGADELIFAVTDHNSAFLAPRKMHIDIKKSNIVATNNSIDALDVKIYPNPATNIVTVENLGKPNGHFQSQILDLTGKIMKPKQNSQNRTLTFDTHDLLPGIYIVQSIIDGTKINHKLIIQ